MWWRAGCAGAAGAGCRGLTEWVQAELKLGATAVEARRDDGCAWTGLQPGSRHDDGCAWQRRQPGSRRDDGCAWHRAPARSPRLARPAVLLLRPLRQDAAQDEPDVGGALAEAAHEVREPLACRTARRRARGSRRRPGIACRSRRMPYSIWNSKRSGGDRCSAANSAVGGDHRRIVRGDGGIGAVARAAASSGARRPRRRPPSAGRRPRFGSR